MTHTIRHNQNQYQLHFDQIDLGATTANILTIIDPNGQYITIPEQLAQQLIHLLNTPH